MSRLAAIVALLALAGSAWGADLPPRLAQAVERAQAADLPVEAVESKALEGLAKGVPVERIGPVLDALVADLHEAKALTPESSPEAWVGGARALRAGATDRAVQSLAADDDSGRTLHAVADLLGLGVSEIDAVRVVEAANNTATPELDVARVAGTAAALISRGTSPTKVATQVLTGLSGQHAGAASIPSGGPGNNGNGNAFGHTDGHPGKAKGHTKK